MEGKLNEKTDCAYIVLTMALSLVACGETGGSQESKPPENRNDVVESTPVPIQDPEPTETQPTGPGACTLLSGFEISLFYKTVRNDVTGKWRLSASSSSMPVSDCAVEYYKEDVRV